MEGLIGIISDDKCAGAIFGIGGVDDIDILPEDLESLYFLKLRCVAPVVLLNKLFASHDDLFGGGVGPMGPWAP